MAVITADGQMRGGKAIPLKAAVDEALRHGRLRQHRDTSSSTSARAAACKCRRGRDLWWHDVVDGPGDTCEPDWVDAEHPLFILYTSGSTGKPKGVQHSTGGYLLGAMLTMQWVFDYKPTTTSSGAPPTSAGSPATAMSPTARWPWAPPRSCSKACRPIPDAGRFWKIIQDHKVTIFYTAPTAIRALIKLGRRAARRNTTCRRCACWAPSASRSIRKPGCGTHQRDRRQPLPDRRHLVADRNRRPS